LSDQNPNSAIDRENVSPKLIRQPLSVPLIWIWRFIGRHHEILTVILAFVATLAAIWAVTTQNMISRELATQQNFLQFYEQWESEGMQGRRARLAAELLRNSTPDNIDDSPLVFLETLSNATKRGLLDRELVWTTFYVDLTSYWAAAQPYVQESRSREQCPCIFEELEALSKQFATEEARRRGQEASLIGHDAESVRRFLELERKRQLPEKRPD
jgi:hypothetical protein